MIDFLIIIFTYLPSLFVHTILGIGLGAFVMSFFMGDIVDSLVPTLYKSFVKYMSILIIVIGLFLEGGLAVNDSYLEKAKEWNHKIEIAEVKAREATSKIEYIFRDKVVEVQKTQLVYKDRIIRRSLDIDRDCKITSETISILNDAARK